MTTELERQLVNLKQGDHICLIHETLTFPAGCSKSRRRNGASVRTPLSLAAHRTPASPLVRRIPCADDGGCWVMRGTLGDRCLRKGEGLTVATILIIDDQPTDREYLVKLLAEGGHRLLQGADGDDALAIAQVEHIDLIIADILMPTMDGSS